MELLFGLPLDALFRCVSAEWEALFSRGFKGVGLADTYVFLTHSRYLSDWRRER